MAAPGLPRPADRSSGVSMLEVDGHAVARYVWAPDLPLTTSPRPYLHPVRTLAGSTVTDAGPDSHPHQLGISLAAPDVGGHNFWGGRTFVAEHGPAWLDNHGTQRHQRWIRQSSSELVHTLRWIDLQQNTLMSERRSISCRRMGGTAWSLSVRTELTNATGRPLALRSPATQGRAGAGYGGFFWRGPAVTAAVRVLSPTGPHVHGANTPWIAITGTDSGSRPWTVLFLPGDATTAQDRWFVRSRDYLGVGSALTWDQPLVLAPDETITRIVVTVVADGTLSPATAAELADAARATT